MAKDDKDKKTEKKDDKWKRKGEDVVDLASRIGARPTGEQPPAKPGPPSPPAEPPVTRLDAPIPSAPKPRLIPTREDREQSAMIQKAMIEETSAPQPAIPSPRTAPGPGETDLVVTPLPTPDDWHRFELALRKVRGVGQLRTEYYRHGVLKVRVSYQGTERLATALRAGVPGYRVRVIGEDRATLQILVTSEADERRPG
ncbi:MAG TPA: hypothetical protein VGR46_03910 [Candidatus Limnocylindria bacterium]|jgi:hypothetical protein|nr:hypothetical protein [Candidatus Limnocylindria bacterium]